MKQVQFLVNRLREVYLDGKFIANTNIKEQIENLNWQQANYKIGTLNTVAALTFHLNYYLKGILDFSKNGVLEIKDQFSFNMPSINSENEWQQFMDDFLTNANHFITWISSLEEEQLDTVFVDEIYGTYHRNIQAVIEHSYYHLGQISLIKKLIEDDIISKESN